MTTTTATATIRDLIAQARSTGEVDVDEIVNYVWDRIENPWEALRETLRPYVVTNRNKVSGGPSNQRGAQQAAAMLPTPTGSRRWEAASSTFRSIKDQSISLGTKQFKRLGSLTMSDLDYVAKTYRKLASAHDQKAKQTQRLIEAMARHDASTVDELPDGVVEEIWS